MCLLISIIASIRQYVREEINRKVQLVRWRWRQNNSHSIRVNVDHGECGALFNEYLISLLEIMRIGLIWTILMRVIVHKLNGIKPPGECHVSLSFRWKSNVPDELARPPFFCLNSVVEHKQPKQKWCGGWYQCTLKRSGDGPRSCVYRDNYEAGITFTGDTNLSGVNVSVMIVD